MNKLWRNILFWTPRVLGILIAGLLTLLSTDVFAEGYPFWQSIGGFLIHMLPTFAVLVLLVFAWRWEWIGALGFIAFGVWYIAITWSNDMHWSAYAILAGVPILTGILFLVGWVKRGEIRGWHVIKCVAPDLLDESICLRVCPLYEFSCPEGATHLL